MVLGLWFESVRMMLFLFDYFKRASHSHAKTGSYFTVFFSVLFSSVSEGPFCTFFSFGGLLGVPKGFRFGTLLQKRKLLAKRVDLRVCTLLLRFGSVLGSRTSWGAQKRNKKPTNKSSFFWPLYSQSASPGRLGRLGRLAFCNQPALSRLSRLGRLDFSRLNRLGRLSFSSYVIFSAGRSDLVAWCLEPADWLV